ncbi:MAG: ferredoxin [Planctomycetes bacterium]|nr:ferredoxin [Planctomycetota bacterium]
MVERESIDRRSFLQTGLKGAAALAVTAAGAGAAFRLSTDDRVWQIDPWKCVQCGRCETECVLTPSAVDCVHAYDRCGYCNLCFGYVHPNALEQTTAAENQVCPTAAIRRTWIEGPYYEYTIDETLCIGCGKCVKGCVTFGNGSLCLQIRHDRCVHCNICAIARSCPGRAFSRVPARRPYLLKTGGGGGDHGRRWRNPSASS